MKWSGFSIAAVIGTGKYGIARRRRPLQTEVPFNLLLVPPPESAGDFGDGPGQCLSMFFSESRNSAIDLLEVGSAAGQPGSLLYRSSTNQEDGGHQREERNQNEQIYKRKAGNGLGTRCPCARSGTCTPAISTGLGRSDWVATGSREDVHGTTGFRRPGQGGPPDWLR